MIGKQPRAGVLRERRDQGVCSLDEHVKGSACGVVRSALAVRLAGCRPAVGLSPGSGSLYKHFSSKEALLAEGVGALLADRAELRRALSPSDSPQRGNLAEVQSLMQSVAVAGLRRMQRDRDMNRLVFRGLQDFPDLLTSVASRPCQRSSGSQSM